MKNKDIEDELNQLSPLLAQLKKEQKREEGMPANYFSSFEDRLMHRINEEEALQPKAVVSDKESKNWLRALFTFFQPQYISGIAFGAVIGLSIYIGVHFYNQNGLESEVAASTLLAELSLEETEFYLMNNVEDIAAVELAELLKEEEWTEMQEEAEKILETKEDLVPSVTKLPKKENNISTIKKALKETNNDNLLDDITEEDIEGYELF